MDLIVAHEFHALDEDRGILDKLALLANRQAAAGFDPQPALKQTGPLLFRGQFKQVQLPIGLAEGAVIFELVILRGTAQVQALVGRLLFRLQVAGDHIVLDRVVALERNGPVGNLAQFGDLAERPQLSLAVQAGQRGFDLDIHGHAAQFFVLVLVGGQVFLEEGTALDLQFVRCLQVIAEGHPRQEGGSQKQPQASNGARIEQKEKQPSISFLRRTRFYQCTRPGDLFPERAVRSPLALR